MNENEKFNFFGFEVLINSDNKKLIELLQIDFRYFLTEKTVKKKMKIITNIKDDLSDLVPQELVANKQSINSMTFDKGYLRYNDYYGEAVTIFNYKTEECEIYARDINRLHEITYLVILSRQGKWCDRNGFHKIHAMAISNNLKNMILMLPMKGGKTTLFTRFLEDESVGLISDDSPVVDIYGKLHSFPIRFGLEVRDMYTDIVNSIPDTHKSVLKRKLFGPKTLIDMTAYGQRVGRVEKKNIIIQGKRHNSKKTIIKKVGFFAMFSFLITNLVVGIGLPMIIEYFLESTLKDKVTNLKILISRSVSAFNLALRSEKYIAYLGTDIDNNAKEIKKLFL